MTNELFQNNLPSDFWSINPVPTDELWQEAIDNAYEHLGFNNKPMDMKTLTNYVFEEKVHGDKVWHLDSIKKLYYLVKSILPRPFTLLLRRIYHSSESENQWYIDDRYVKFLWGMLDYIASQSHDQTLQFKPLWPENKPFAFVLTHDIEDAAGQQVVRELADIDETYGFRSAFFFVPERYPLDFDLIAELKQRGFEVGIHGLKHDGKLFFSQAQFNKRVDKINHYIEKLGAVGFSSPFTHRHGYWMQKLNIEYDRSFFDIDLYEPMPGGVMTIWPYQLGKYIELPYTLLQDFTLTHIMGETTPTIWLNKLDFIKRYQGMALLNSHPDYLDYHDTRRIYSEFLKEVSQMDCWHALPRDVARWWKKRQSMSIDESSLSLSIRHR